MENKYYNDSIREAIKKLAAFQGELFLSIFNIAMTGELKEWNKSVEIGEVYEFSNEIFEGCSDTNIQLLTELMNKVECICNSICNLNTIKI